MNSWNVKRRARFDSNAILPLCESQRTSTATAVQVDDLTLEVGGVDPCLVVELGQGRGVHDAWDAITGGRQPTMKPCLAGAADGQPRIDSNSGDGKDGGIFLDNDERRGRQDGRVLVEGDGDGDGGRGEGGGEEEAGSSGGELVRMLELLPQRMADLEELALADGLDDEVSFRGAVPRLQQTALHSAFGKLACRRKVHTSDCHSRGPRRKRSPFSTM